MNRQIKLGFALATGFLMLPGTSARAQSIFSLDGKGSAIQTGLDGPVTRVNVADKTFSVSTIFASDSGVNAKHYGFSLAGKAKSSIATLFNKDGFAQDFEYAMFYGERLRIKDPGNDDSNDKYWWTVRASYQTARYKTIDKGETTFTTRALHAPGATLYLQAEPKGGSRLIGLSIGYLTTSNIDDLEQEAIQTQTPLTSANGVTTALVSTVDVYRGAYRKFNSIPLVADHLTFIPSIRMATDVFVRTDLKGNGSKVTPGIAFLFHEKGAPKNITSGIALTYNSRDKYMVRLVGGLNF